MSSSEANRREGNADSKDDPPIGDHEHSMGPAGVGDVATVIGWCHANGSITGPTQMSIRASPPTAR